MRKLHEITSAVRLGQSAEHKELIYAVIAYDVLMAQMQVSANAAQLQKFFVAAELPPLEYIGPENDPMNPEALSWYRAFMSLPRPPLLTKQAGGLYDEDDAFPDNFDCNRPHSMPPTLPGQTSRCTRCGDLWPFTTPNCPNPDGASIDTHA